MYQDTILIKDVLNLTSGRIFLSETKDGYLIESTEMRDVAVDGKRNEEVRNTLDPHIIWKHLVPNKDKWLLTVSTQKGCTHSCQFCDVANLKFKGNLSQEEIEAQVELVLTNTDYINASDKVKIGFARMGEPAHNLKNVLPAMKNLPNISKKLGKDFRWLPCFNSILPRRTQEGLTGFDVIDQIIDMKENYFDGFLHFQISCNTTDEAKKKELFGGADVLSLKEIIDYINKKEITNRTVTLNFIVIDGVEVDVDKLIELGLNKEKFTVKLIPLNATDNAKSNELDPYANYENYNKLEELSNKFAEHGIPVIFDAIAKCEEAGLCCGQLAQIFQ